MTPLSLQPLTTLACRTRQGVQSEGLDSSVGKNTGPAEMRQPLLRTHSSPEDKELRVGTP